MGLGVLHGSPMTYLSPNWYASGDMLAYWIEREIPCFAGDIPAKYTDALLAVFRKHNVPREILRDAFSKLAKKGIRFEWSLKGIEWGIVSPVARFPSHHQQMNPISKGEADRSRRYAFEEYERKFVLAIKTNNDELAAEIIVAVLALLWAGAKSYGMAKQAARPKAMVEWEEFNAAVNEALDRARTLQTHTRTLSKAEYEALRAAQTPTGLRNMSLRLATQLPARTGTSGRRGRR